MSNIYFLEPSWNGTGLTNQIYFIIYGIIYCINNNKRYLVLNNFRLEPMTEKFCRISDILDIHYLNILLNKYDIIVFDRNTLNFNIESITYGLNDKTINITEEILRKYYVNNKLQIPIETILNDIKGDPYPGEAKKLVINYKLNDTHMTEEYSEYIHNDIIINLQTPENILNWSQIDKCYTENQEVFNYLLKKIKFINRFINYSNNALLIDSNNEYTHLPLINLNDRKINVIHLRVEKDMTGHMLTHNKMNQEDYDINLQNKYIELIKNNFLKDDIIFVLSYDLSNNVINFLKDNGYEFYITKKNIFDGREKHAIIDLLIGEKCNNNFIGNWNFNIRQGSTFSYYLYVRNNALNNIFIDMYNIKFPEVIKKNYIIEGDNYEQTMKQLVNNVKTDKNTTHSYLDLYQNLLSSKKNTAKNILEVGIGYPGDNGGSIKLWHDYFINANVYALDIQHIKDVWNEIKNKDRIKLFTSTDAYDEVNFTELFLNKNIKFDMMLDDGPHTLESMIQFIKLYSQIMTEDGILIIEDVQSIDWIDELKKVVPADLVNYIEVYDLRKNKNRYDDIVFVINKNKIVTRVDKFIDGENSIKYILENNIDGSIVECGVYSGDFQERWIKELIKNNIHRELYLYDTFTGLTEPGENDYTTDIAVLDKCDNYEVRKRWESQIIDKNINGWCYASLDVVKNRLKLLGYPENKLHYIVGDVMETLKSKENIPDKIAILRLDTDWYESSKFELEKLYDNVVLGGLIIFDDYYHWEGQRLATNEFFTTRNLQYEFINTNNGKTAVIVKK